MAVFDIIVLVLILIGFYRGFSLGFLKVLTALITLILGLFLLRLVFWGVFTLIDKSSISEFGQSFIQLIIASIVLFLVFKYALVLIEKALKLTGLNIFNRILGAILSLSVTVVLLSLVCYFLRPMFLAWEFLQAKSSSLFYILSYLGRIIID